MREAVWEVEGRPEVKGRALVAEDRAAAGSFGLPIEAVPTGMVVVDEAGRIVLLNATFETLFAYTRRDLIGRHVEMLVPERFRARVRGLGRELLADPLARPVSAGLDFFGLRKDGVEIPVEVGLNPLSRPDGRFVLVSVVDLTDHKRVERELQALQRERDALLHEVHHRANDNPQVTSSLVPVPAPPDARPPGSRAVRRELERILGSADFDGPPRSREFLRYVVEETLAGRSGTITQSAIATNVFGRADDFDAMVDPIVRIQAGRLRRSLERYYLLSGKEDPILIAVPKGAYVPAFRAVPVPEAAAAPAEEAPATAPEDAAPASGMEPGWPAVVVGGFEVVNPEAALLDVAREMDEELAIELGRYGTIRVLRQRDLAGRGTSRPAGARFALDGRVRRDGQGLRVTARLVDGATGEQIWGEEYHLTLQSEGSGSAGDMPRVIAARIAAEEGLVVQTLAAERRKRRPAEATPYDAMLLSYDFFLARGPDTFGPAVEALRRVVEAAPDCGVAWTRLARVYYNNYALEVTATPTPIDEAVSFAHRGVRLDPESRNARCVLAACLIVKGELASARDELERALQSSPGSLAYLEMIGCLLMLTGDWERGLALTRSARERNPHCAPHVLYGTWADGLRRGDYEQAYAAALEYRDPTFFWRTVMRASALGLLGRASEARADLADLLSRKPDFPARGRVLIGHWIKFPEVMDRITDGLARAGLVLA